MLRGVRGHSFGVDTVGSFAAFSALLRNERSYRPLRLDAAGNPNFFWVALSVTSDDAIGSFVNSMFLNEAMTRLPSIGLPVMALIPSETSVSASAVLVLM